MRKVIKRFISGLVCTVMLVNSMPAQQLLASEQEFFNTAGNDDIGAFLHNVDSTLPEGVVILPAQTDLELPEDLRDDTLSGNGASYYVMGTGQVDVEEKGVYAITVCRLGDTDKEGSVLVKSIDYSALYGKDYKIRDERFSTVKLDSEKTLLEQTAEEENIEETRAAMEEMLSGVDNVIESAEPSAEEAEIEGTEPDADEADIEGIEPGADEEPVEDNGSEDDEFDDDSEKPESSLSLAELKRRETGNPVRGTVEDDQSEDMVGSIKDMLISQMPFNTGDQLEGSSVTKVVFAPGEKEKQLVFEVLEDEESEGDEIIHFSLVTPENDDMVLEPNMSTIMIKDDEPKERSQMAFSKDTYETDKDSIKVTLVRQGARYNMMTATLSVQNRNDAKDSMVKEISFQPYLMEKNVELVFNSGDEAMDYDLELTDIKGGDPGDICQAAIHVESAVGRSSSDIILREESVDGADLESVGHDAAEDGADLESVGHDAAEDGSQIKINDHVYRLEPYTDGSKPGDVYKIMSLGNDTKLDRKNPVQVGDYYSAESDYFRNKNIWEWGDSSHANYSGYRSEGKYMNLEWYSNWPFDKGGISMFFEIPMRPYAGALLDYTALSDWNSVETEFSALYPASAFGLSFLFMPSKKQIDKNLKVTRRQNGTSDNDDKSIEEREFMGPIRMLNGIYQGKGGKNSQVKSMQEEGKIPLMGASNTRFVTSTGKTAIGALNPTEHVYGVACMYKVIKFTVEEPSKMQYKKADGSTVTEYPARVFAPDDHPRFYKESLTVDIEQNDIDIRVPKGRIKSWVIKPKDGTEFTVNVADAEKLSYLSQDGLTFTVNDDFIDTLSRQGIGVKKGDMTDTGYLMNVSIKPVFEYIPVHVKVLPSEGEGSFASSLINEPKEYTFNVGDTINLAGKPGDGWYYSGYSLSTYKNYDDTQARSDAPVVQTPLDLKLSNDELYVLKPVFIKEDNRIEIEMSDDAKKYFEIQGLCSQDELPDYLKGKNILKITNRESDSDPVTKPVPGDAYEIRLLNTDNNDGTYRPVFTIVNTGQTVDGHVLDFLAQAGADGKRNRIKVDAKKVDPGKFKYFEISGKAVYSSAKLRNADGRKTIEPASGVSVKSAGRSVSGYKDGKKAQVLLRSEDVTDTNGYFILKGFEAVPGDTISVSLDNGDRQQVKYVKLPGSEDGDIQGLSASERTLEVYVPDDQAKTMVTRSQKTQVYVINTEPLGMPIISPRSPEVKKLTYSYDNHEMKDTSKNMVELHPEEDIWVSVEVLEKKDNQIKGVDFILYDKNGREKEIGDGNGASQHGTPNKDGTVYKARFKSEVGLQAGDTLYVQIRGSEYTTVTYSNGDTEKVYKKYPKLNSGLTFGVEIERAEPQTFTISTDAGDSMKDLPFVGDLGSEMMSNTGSLTLNKTYVDPAHPDTSAYYMTVGLGVSVQDNKRMLKQIDQFKNGKHVDEQKDFNEKLDAATEAADPYQLATYAENKALADSKRNLDYDQLNEKVKRWEQDVKMNHRPEIKQRVKEQQIADSISKLNENNGSLKAEQPKWDAKLCVTFILEYVLDKETNEFVFAGGQYMIGGAVDYSRCWHFYIGVPVYIAFNLGVNPSFDGAWVTDAGKKSFAEFKKTTNLEEYLVPALPWFNLGIKAKFMPGVGIYGVIGARGQVEAAIVGRYTAAQLAPGQSNKGLLVSIGGGIAIDLLAIKFSKNFPKATFSFGCFKKGKKSLESAGIMEEDLGKLLAYDLSGKEISYFGKKGHSGDLERAGLGIKAPANIEDQNVLVENAAEYIRPHIVYGKGDKRFITYLKKDGKGNARIAYAVDNGSGFSGEQFVDPGVTDGTDTTSDLLCVDGKVYIAWTHGDALDQATIDDEDEVSVAGAKDALQSMNLKFAVYDFATNTMSDPVAVTDDRFLNQNVRLFADDDKVEMYFYKKDIDAAETAQQIISVKSNYTTWAMAEYDTVSKNFVKYGDEGNRKNWKFVEIKKPINDPLVLDYASAVYEPDGKKSSVSSNSWRMSLYTVDRGLNSEDEDTRNEGMTFANSEIWLCATKTGDEGKEFSAKLAEGDVTNARLNIMSDDVLITWLGESRTLYTLSAQKLFSTGDDGITLFEHYCNNDTYESETQDGGHETKRYEIDASEKQFAQDEDEIVSLFQYQVVSGADGNDYLFTLAPGEEGTQESGQELWGATYYRDDSSVNARSGWGELTQITHYKKIIDEMSLAVNENHQASILANIYDNTVDESGLASGDYKLVELDCEPETSLEFRYEPYFAGENIYPIPGETARIDFTLENEGLLPAKNYRIDVKEIQKGQERQACEPIIYNADTAEIDETIFTGEERDFSVSVNLPESLDDLSYTVAVTETDGDGSKTYGTNKALLEVERSADLIEEGDTYILDGQRVEDIYNLVMLKYYSYGGRKLTEDEMDQIEDTLDYSELIDLGDLFLITGANDLNELAGTDLRQKGFDTDIWYVIARYFNAGNEDALNVKATATYVLDDDSLGEVIGESSTIKNLAKRNIAALVVPIDTKNGTLFNDLGVFDVSVEVTVNGESIGDDISLMAYTGENVGVCRDDGLDHFELNQGESIALDMVSHPFNERAQLSYVSDNADIAAVSEEGVVTALSEGECHVFVYDYSAENGMPFTKVKVSVTGTEKGDEDIKPARVPMVQTLTENRLTFDSVEDGDTLYLLKGGKYTYEEGLMIIPSVKNAVKQKPKKLKLIVRKDSVLTLQKGDKTKTVTMRAMRVKKKRVNLNAQKNSAKLSELFTGLEALMPDVQGGQYAVTVKKDPKGVLKWEGMPPADGKYVTLDSVSVNAAGNRGSAKITAVFGGKKYNATIKYK